MGTVHKQPMDEYMYLPDNYIVYIDEDGRQYDVQYIKDNVEGIHGVVSFKQEDKQGKEYWDMYKGEFITPTLKVRHIIHRGGNAKGQRFDGCFVPVKFIRQSICTALYMPMLIQLINGTYKPMINSTHKQGHYTKSEIISVICDIKGTNKFKRMTPQQLSDFYNDLTKIGLQENDDNRLPVGYLETKWKIERKFITDACFVCYVMSDKHRNFFTDNAEINGVCILDKYLWSMNPTFIKLKK